MLFLVHARKGETALLSPYNVSIFLTDTKGGKNRRSLSGRVAIISIPVSQFETYKGLLKVNTGELKVFRGGGG